jgi:hypothetical protein
MALETYLILALVLPFAHREVQPRQKVRKLAAMYHLSKATSSFLLLLSTVNAWQSPPSCKAAPGTSNWPSFSQWSALNHSISGQLLQPAPPGAVCYPDQPTYNATLCSLVQNDLFLDIDYFSTLPSACAWPFWNNDSCLPFQQFLSMPCSYEGFPIYVVNATNKDDVKKGVDFARENNVRLVVKASGHDYSGRYYLSLTIHFGLHFPITNSNRQLDANEKQDDSSKCHDYLGPQYQRYICFKRIQA